MWAGQAESCDADLHLAQAAAGDKGTLSLKGSSFLFQTSRSHGRSVQSASTAKGEYLKRGVSAGHKGAPPQVT